ncbi:MAG: hypothetical protein AAGE80_04490 [Pseudomonadota bacterium]
MGRAKTETADEKATRLADALRANLHRRKAQKRARSAAEAEAEDEKQQPSRNNEAE